MMMMIKIIYMIHTVVTVLPPPIMLWSLPLLPPAAPGAPDYSTPLSTYNTHHGIFFSLPFFSPRLLSVPLFLLPVPTFITTRRTPSPNGNKAGPPSAVHPSSGRPPATQQQGALAPPRSSAARPCKPAPAALLRVGLQLGEHVRELLVGRLRRGGELGVGHVEGQVAGPGVQQALHGHLRHVRPRDRLQALLVLDAGHWVVVPRGVIVTRYPHNCVGQPRIPAHLLALGLPVGGAGAGAGLQAVQGLHVAGHLGGYLRVRDVHHLRLHLRLVHLAEVELAVELGALAGQPPVGQRQLLHVRPVQLLELRHALALHVGHEAGEGHARSHPLVRLGRDLPLVLHAFREVGGRPQHQPEGGAVALELEDEAREGLQVELHGHGLNGHVAGRGGQRAREHRLLVVLGGLPADHAVLEGVVAVQAPEVAVHVRAELEQHALRAQRTPVVQHAHVLEHLEEVEGALVVHLLAALLALRCRRNHHLVHAGDGVAQAAGVGEVALRVLHGRAQQVQRVAVQVAHQHADAEAAQQQLAHDQPADGARGAHHQHLRHLVRAVELAVQDPIIHVDIIVEILWHPAIVDDGVVQGVNVLSELAACCHSLREWVFDLELSKLFLIIPILLGHVKLAVSSIQFYICSGYGRQECIDPRKGQKQKSREKFDLHCSSLFFACHKISPCELFSFFF
mmetsp:Transcript_2761/g.4202  ORF Transcript_2761/g.4202 Transcript_2761/m.4202 type:complete len:679 (+) Transcript_2761:188-2224(+)